METRCAWCGAESGNGSGRDAGKPISHGICPPCERRLSAHQGMPLERFLESLGTPVMLVDVERGGRVTSANRQALALADGDGRGAEDRLLGDVFECRNASLPGGCGRTVHCSGCTIRSAVEQTWSTGEAMVRVPASLTPDGANEVALEISTERVGGRVLLRIDRWRPTGDGG